MYPYSTPASLPAITDPHNLAPFILEQLYVEGSIPASYEEREPAAFNLGAATLAQLGWPIEQRGARYELAARGDESGSLVALRRLVARDPAARRWMDQVSSTHTASFFDRLSASHTRVSRPRPNYRQRTATTRTE